MARKKTPTGAIASTGEKTEKKRLGKPPAPTPPSNVSDDTYKEFCARALREKLALDDLSAKRSEQNGRYRDVLKKAKEAGVDPAAIRWWLAEKAKDFDVLQSEHAARMRVARLMNMPINTQLGMFDDTGAGGGVSGSTDRGVMQHEAYQIGLTAGKAAETFDPERYPNDPDLQGRYKDGWEDGQEENKRDLGRGPKLTNGGAEQPATH